MSKHNQQVFLTAFLAVCILVFCFLWWCIIWWADGTIVQSDRAFIELLAKLRTSDGVRVFTSISFFGKLWVVVAIMLWVILRLLSQGKKTQSIWLAMSVAITSGVSTFTKFVFARERPEFASYQEIGFSFPSFHAAISIGLYGFLAYLLIRESRFKRSKYVIFWVAFLIAFFIWFSRMYLGVHYLTDVIAGYCVGLSAVCISLKYVLKKS